MSIWSAIPKPDILLGFQALRASALTDWVKKEQLQEQVHIFVFLCYKKSK